MAPLEGDTTKDLTRLLCEDTTRRRPDIVVTRGMTEVMGEVTVVPEVTAVVVATVEGEGEEVEGDMATEVAEEDTVIEEAEAGVEAARAEITVLQDHPPRKVLSPLRSVYWSSHYGMCDPLNSKVSVVWRRR